MNQTTSHNPLFIPLSQETGKFIFSTYGEYKALIFQGDSDFLKRCENLVINFGLLGRAAIREWTENRIFILAPEERIMQGLIDYFIGEIVMEKQDIDYKEEIIEDDEKFDINISYDENKVLELARIRMTDFWTNRVEQSTILGNFYQSTNDNGYGTGRIREESEKNGDSPDEIEKLVDVVHDNGIVDSREAKLGEEAFLERGKGNDKRNQSGKMEFYRD